KPGFLALGSKPAESFTLSIVFEADLTLINTTGLSCRVPRAGQGWALYLNGNRIHDELFLAPDGGLAAERHLRDTIVPLDKRMLKVGRNVLSFHIVGDPSDERTGLATDGLVIDSYARLAGLGTEYLDIMLIGVYALFGLYHFILFAQRPENRSYLLYGVATIVLGLFLFTRTGSAAIIVRDTAVLLRIDYASMFLLLPIFMAFFDLALGKRTTPVTRIAFGLGVALLPLALFARPETAHNLWELATGLELAYVLAFVLAPKTIAAARTASGGPGARLRKAFSSAAGRLAVGALVVAVAAAVDIVAVNSGGEMFYSKYAFLFLVLGAAAILATQFVGVYGEVEALSVSLERKIAERSLELEAATERQRRLGEEIERNSLALQNAAEIQQRDMLIAERVQRGLFPAEPPAVEGWDLALAYRAAAGVSGDFYEIFAEEGRLRGLVVGDVSGHGVGAGLVAVLSRAVFARRFEEFRGRPLGECMTALHEELAAELGGVDEYLTAVLLRFDGSRVEYANAAHPDILLRRAGSNQVIPIVPRTKDDFRGPPLGKEGFEGGWSALRFSPGAGDTLLVYTDCLEEAQDPEGRRYGRERLEASLAAAPADTAAGLLEALLADLASFAASTNFSDDLTIVVLKRTS
ncbi:MAG: SpoIIE family protein phosphatase, partial [Spirochaetaceae bacterium]|nr:SpoIIE family protein phosphatase [Spirochaetaceae bacterium]